MFDYNTVSIHEIAQKLGIPEAKRTAKSIMYHCFNGHKKACKSLELFNDNGFVCHDCGIKGNSVELVRLNKGFSVEDSITWLRSEFSGEEQFTLNKVKADFNKLHCRIIAKVAHDKRFWFKDPSELKPCDYNLDNVNETLGKKFSSETMELLKDIVSVQKDKHENKYLCFVTDKNKNIILINDLDNPTIVVEGRTDFVTAVEVFKDEFKDYNFVSRYNKNIEIPALSGEVMFFLDSDEDLQDKEIIVEGKKVIEKGLISKLGNLEHPCYCHYVKFPDKDLSDYFAKVDAKEVKSYVENNYIWFFEKEKPKQSITETKNEAPEGKNQSPFATDLVYSQDNLVEFFNSFLGFDRASGKFWVNFTKGGWTLLPEKAVQSLLSNYKVYTVNKKGEDKVTPALRTWLESPDKRIISGLVFSPNKEDYSEINLFTGYKTERKQGDISLFKAYMFDIICKKDPEKLRFLEWFIACTFQFKKVPYHLILKGEQGAGKSFLPSTLAKILGQYAIIAQDIGIIIQQFNGHLLNKNFVYLEEAFFGGDTKTNDKLKSLITSKKMTYELKHSGQRFEGDTYINYITTTNHDTPTKVERDDRRTVIFTLSEEKLNNKVYFKALDTWLQGGGYSFLLDYFLSLEVSEWEDFANLGTEDKKEQKLNSMDSVERFWHDMLTDDLIYTEYKMNEDGSYTDIRKSLLGDTEANILFDVYLRYCKKTNTRPNTQTLFGSRTRKIFNIETKRVGTRKLTIYSLNDESMKEAFNKYFKQEIIPLPKKTTEAEIPF